MMSGMPPSTLHRFHLTDADIIVELHWRGPTPQPARSLLSRVFAFFSGPGPDPRQVVNHKVFDRAVTTLASDTEAAYATFDKLGYDVELHQRFRAAA